jgi:hypothetical protein
MFRYIAPIILVGVAVAGFFLYAKPLWDESKVIKTEIASYDEALTNADTLERERNSLTQKYNAIDPNLLTRLDKLLPENVDNIRLVLEIGNIAEKHGMELTGISYDSTIDNKKSSKDSKDKTETPSIGAHSIDWLAIIVFI